MSGRDERDEAGRRGGDRVRVIRRIVVALDASPDSLAALEASAELAAALSAELVGLYVEDVNVLRLAGRAHATEIDLLSGRSRRVGRRDLERQLRIQAARARRTLERLAEQRSVEWSFRTVRGRVTAEILGAGADLITLGVRGHGPGRGPGSTVQSLLEAAGAPVLLTRRGVALGASVHVVDDGSAAARRALEIASGVARKRGLPLAVLRTAAPRTAASAPGEAQSEPQGEPEDAGAAAGVARAVMRWLPAADAETLLAVLVHDRSGLLILPRSAPPADLRLLLRRVRCPVLVVD